MLIHMFDFILNYHNCFLYKLCYFSGIDILNEAMDQKKKKKKTYDSEMVKSFENHLDIVEASVDELIK